MSEGELMDDTALLAGFEDGTLPRSEWTHEAHVRVAYLYSTKKSSPDAIDCMRRGIQAYNVATGLRDSLERGYHETITIAFMTLVLVARRSSPDAQSSVAFVRQHPELLDKNVLGRFYSSEQLNSRRAKDEFVAPDLVPLRGMDEGASSDNGVTMDVIAYNRSAWDQCVDDENRWTVPASSAEITAARQGELQVLLTPTKHVPAEWLLNLAGSRLLCLASGGGQQAPMFAAAGARVTSFDNSPKQLSQDKRVAEREGLSLEIVQGDMADLSQFDDGSFDLIFHPCSNCFVPDVNPVWGECFRVLRASGVLLAGFTNPARYIFDDERMENGSLEVKYAIPYSDLTSLDEQERESLVFGDGQPLQFAHTMADQIGGQLRVGFLLSGFYEDNYGPGEDAISAYLDTFIATRAIKPG